MLIARFGYEYTLPLASYRCKTRKTNKQRSREGRVGGQRGTWGYVKRRKRKEDPTG